MSGTEAVIEVTGVTKTFRSWGAAGAWSIRRPLRRPSERALALDGVHLRVARGEFVGLLGQNGAGKSTLIKLMTGLLLPDTGTVRVCGLDPYGDRERNARNMGVTFGQRTQLWWDLPARDSFSILRDVYGLPERVWREALAELDDVLTLSAFWDTPVRFLSLGQRVRCDLAAALLHRPRVLFLDEPTIGLDVMVKDQVRELLSRLAATGDHSVVLTTHDMAEVEALCRRIVVIDRGRVVHDGQRDRLAVAAGAERSFLVEFETPPPRLDLVRATVVSVRGATVRVRPVSGADRAQVTAELLAAHPVRSVRYEGATAEDVLRALHQRARPEPASGAAGAAT
ncbi:MULTISPECIES: ABC transporter ATP-binding protein [Streptomyces]|uniref:ATP-binding cassette domain-containing protein n=1 Tax=Streptomyces edwardsiae TaxID=3075527 RepID=A0ABU2QMS7_9ACTN|nr:MULTISPECIES: ATP-binding cassette domain-containing protein [unclassified Streptomyces]MDT0405288.1 ATP-binding cassette domain-containing protein [Streptomyces sp. DSM 41635]